MHANYVGGYGSQGLSTNNFSGYGHFYAPSGALLPNSSHYSQFLAANGGEPAAAAAAAGFAAAAYQQQAHMHGGNGVATMAGSLRNSVNSQSTMGGASSAFKHTGVYSATDSLVNSNVPLHHHVGGGGSPHFLPGSTSLLHLQSTDASAASLASVQHQPHHSGYSVAASDMTTAMNPNAAAALAPGSATSPFNATKTPCIPFYPWMTPKTFPSE